MDTSDLPSASPGPSNGKAPIVRGARACRTCRAAKMKCVGGDEGGKSCQRCQRAGVDCVFDKHRRGRKPGSKLSEASKMLRRLEKGLHTAKSISQANELNASASYIPPESRGFYAQSYRSSSTQDSGALFPATDLPPIQDYAGSSRGSAGGYDRRMDVDDDDSDGDDSDSGLRRHVDYPAKMIKKERTNNLTLRNILNPVDEPPTVSPTTSRHNYGTYNNNFSAGPAEASSRHPSRSYSVQPSPHQDLYASRTLNHIQPPNRQYSAGDQSLPPSPGNALRPAPLPHGLEDPLSAGLIDEARASNLLEILFLRLNPFINLFDPALHSVSYLRSRSPFLFTVLMTISMKFWEGSTYPAAQKLTQEWTARAFAEGWSSVEVCQAFCCLTYWKDPDDTRTWMYIGYAARMAVELGLNKFVARPPPNESDFVMRQRRNAERTYLVIFVHDRSLSMQTGRQWMLPECELVRHAETWHLRGHGSSAAAIGGASGAVTLSSGSAPPPPPAHAAGAAPTAGSPTAKPQPQDVILAAFVQLRRLATETFERLNNAHRGGGPYEVNYEAELSMGNTKLQQWQEHWHSEMAQAHDALDFHFAFLSLFRLNVRLFLNSYGLQAAFATKQSTRVQLSLCYESAVEMLSIIRQDIPRFLSLQYVQDSINTMSAYAAVFLLKLLRSPSVLAQLPLNADQQVLSDVSATATAYRVAEGHHPGPSVAHARFLRSLVDNHRPLPPPPPSQPQGGSRTASYQHEEPLRERFGSHATPVNGGPAMSPPLRKVDYPPPASSSGTFYPQQLPPFSTVVPPDHHEPHSHHRMNPVPPHSSNGSFPPPMSAERTSSHVQNESYESNSFASTNGYNYTPPTPNSAHPIHHSSHYLPHQQPQQQRQTILYNDSTSEDARYRQHMFRDIGFGFTENDSFGEVGVFVPGGAGPAISTGPSFGSTGYGGLSSMSMGGGMNGPVYMSS